MFREGVCGSVVVECVKYITFVNIVFLPFPDQLEIFSRGIPKVPSGIDSNRRIPHNARTVFVISLSINLIDKHFTSVKQTLSNAPDTNGFLWLFYIDNYMS